MQRAILENKVRNLAVVAASTFALAACGGGGGGGGDHGGGLASGMFTRFVPSATTANYTGLLGAAAYARWQYLYRASDMRSSGKITGIAVQYFNAMAAAVSCPNMTIKLSHTNLTSPVGLSTTFANNVQTGQGSQVTVLNNATVTYPAGAVGDFYTVSLSTPFDYNGFDNLLIEFERTGACSATVFDRAVTGMAYPAAVYTFTNGSPTGTASDFLNNFRFVFAGGDNKLDFGGVGTNNIPFNTNAAGIRMQNLYLASEINGSGPITGVAFQMSVPTVAAAYTYTLRLGHSTVAALDPTYASNYSGSPTTVANAVANFTIPANVPAGEWIWVPIPDGVFTYNGTDNLIVDMSTSAASANNSVRTVSVAGRRAVGLDHAGATALVVDSSLAHVALRFHGGAVAVITNGGASTGFAFSTGAAGRLNLYRASELGSAGTITSVACRMLDASSTATSYANYQVIIGHSNVPSLSATSTDNFVSQTMAVNGTVSVPAGLLAGDWIEVPLSTPFAYDGKSNLAIWMGTTAASGAAAGHACFVSTGDAARYPGQMASGSPGAAAVLVQDFKFDMRLRLSR